MYINDKVENEKNQGLLFSPACQSNHKITDASTLLKKYGTTDYREFMYLQKNKNFVDFFIEKMGYHPNLITENGEDEEVKEAFSYRDKIIKYRKQGRLFQIETKKFDLLTETIEGGGSPFQLRDYYGFRYMQTRGAVSKVMSDKSRWGLKKEILKCDFSQVEKKQMILITLTFPVHIENIKDAQELVRVFNQRMKRAEISLFWKKEYTLKKRVHYHMFSIYPQEVELGDYFVKRKGELFPYDREKKAYITDRAGVKGLRYQLQNVWSDAVNKKFNVKDTEKTFNASIDMQYVKNPQSVATYLSDYLIDDGGNGKKDKGYQNTVPENIQNSGRWWGVINMKKFYGEVQEDKISYEQYKEIQKNYNEIFSDRKDKKEIRTIIESDKTKELIEKILKEEGKGVKKSDFLSSNFQEPVTIQYQETQRIYRKAVASYDRYTEMKIEIDKKYREFKKKRNQQTYKDGCASTISKWVSFEDLLHEESDEVKLSIELQKELGGLRYSCNFVAGLKINKMENLVYQNKEYKIA